MLQKCYLMSSLRQLTISVVQLLHVASSHGVQLCTTH